MEELNIFKARSFWLMVGSVLATLVNVLGYEFKANEFADVAITVAPAALALWAYIERLLGQKKLVLSKKS